MRSAEPPYRSIPSESSEIMQAATCLAINLGKGLNRIADAIQANAQATELLARATAGEFGDAGDVEPALGQSLSDVPGRGLR